MGVRPSRVSLLLLLAVLAFPASALGSNEVTRGVVGYGTVHVSAATAPADCTSPASTPGGTEANVNAGSESDCAAFDAGSYDTCTTSAEGSSACHLTLQAQAAEAAGWRFDHWSGDCSGTSTTCNLEDELRVCETEPKPHCETIVTGPFTAVAHFVDTRAPTTSFSQAPANNSVVFSDTQSQQFTFSTDEEAEAPGFGCKRDAGSFAGCSSGIVWSSIADGIHDFCVRATDPSGLTGTTCRHWEQETNPTASIANHPATTTGTPDASFTWTSNKESHPADGSTLSYRCWLDAAAPAACSGVSKSYSLLANGQHTFHVEVVFQPALGGGAHTGTASYTWTQADVTGPTVSLEASPDGTVNLAPDRQAQVSWAGSEPSEQQTFLCKLDDDPAGFQPCSSPVTLQGLGDGVHDFRIEGRDFLGNLGPVEDVHWDQEVPPAASFTGGPVDGSIQSSRQTAFSFTSNNARAGFECELDDGGFAPCTSPHAVEVAGDGSHTFAVRGVVVSPLDGATYRGEPVSRAWSVADSGKGAGGSSCGAGACGLATAAKAVPVRAGKARVKLTCAALDACKGTLELLARPAKASRSRLLVASSRPVLLGKASFSLAAGKKATVAVPLKARGEALLRSAPAGRLKASLAGTGVRARAVLLREKG